MNQAIELLIRADDTLAKISVRGDDAYAMVNARSLLKAAYDVLRSKKEEENVPDKSE